MATESISADDLRKLLVQILAGATDKPESHWDVRLGELVRVDLTRSPASNWTVAVGKRSDADGEALRQAVALVRAEHPYTQW